jgi:hypothetical protein
MDCFIKKIFDGKVDNLVHLQFQKFSRGDFQNRALIKAKNSKGIFSISTTAEYANELVRIFAEKLNDRSTKITGIVVSTKNLEGDLDFKDKKQFMGVKQYIIDKEMSGKEIISLCDKFPNLFIGLSFKVDNDELKIKPKAPRSAKPSTKKDEDIKIDFCKVKTSDMNIVKSLIFDSEIGDFKELEIKHSFLINDIIMPENEKDFAKIRELSKKKGKIIREITVDGKKIKKEANLEA